MFAANSSAPVTDKSEPSMPESGGVLFDDQLYDLFQEQGRMSKPQMFWRVDDLLHDYMHGFLCTYARNYKEKSTDKLRDEFATWARANQAHLDARKSSYLSLDPECLLITPRDSPWHCQPDLVIFASSGGKRITILAHAHVLSLYCFDFNAFIADDTSADIDGKYESKPTLVQPQALDLSACTSRAVHTLVLGWMFNRSVSNLLSRILRKIVRSDLEKLVQTIMEETEKVIDKDVDEEGIVLRYWVPEDRIEEQLSLWLDPLHLVPQDRIWLAPFEGIKNIAAALQFIRELWRVVYLLHIKDYELEGWLSACDNALSNLMVKSTGDVVEHVQDWKTSATCDRCMQKEDMRAEAGQSEETEMGTEMVIGDAGDSGTGMRMDDETGKSHSEVGDSGDEMGSD